MGRRRGRGAARIGTAPAATSLLLALLWPAAARAQPVVAGGFDDASIPSRWELRLRLGISFEGTSEQFGTTIKKDIDMWKRVVQKAGVKAE